MGAAAHSLPIRNKLLANNEFLKINTQQEGSDARQQQFENSDSGVRELGSNLGLSFGSYVTLGKSLHLSVSFC